MKIKLIKIGRKQVTKTINVPSLEHALAEVDKYVVSREVCLVPDEKENEYFVSVGMGHRCGTVRILEP